MARTLTDEDAEAIVEKLLTRVAARLSAPHPEPAFATEVATELPPKLAFKKKEVLVGLGISSSTLWRLEVLGRLRPVPGIRHKIYARAEIERFLKGDGKSSWR